MVVVVAAAAQEVLLPPSPSSLGLCFLLFGGVVDCAVDGGGEKSHP